MRSIFCLEPSSWTFSQELKKDFLPNQQKPTQGLTRWSPARLQEGEESSLRLFLVNPCEKSLKQRAARLEQSFVHKNTAA